MKNLLSVVAVSLVLGLIGVSYGLAAVLNASGFLAVFATGVAFRAVERRQPGRCSSVPEGRSGWGCGGWGSVATTSPVSGSIVTHSTR